MKINLFKVLFLGFSVLLLASCDQLKDLTYATAPNPLELHGDSVAISVTVNIPPKGIKKKVSVEIAPTLGNAKLGTWKFQGEKVTGNGQTITFKPGGTVTFTDVVAYDPSMEHSELGFTGKVFKGVKEKTKEALPYTKLADATIITPLLVQTSFKPIFATNSIPEFTRDTVFAEINYLKGKSDVRAAELKDKDVVALMEWIKIAEADPRIKINSISVNGYASPEGEGVRNTNLSDDRSKSASKAFLELLKKAKSTLTVDNNGVKGMGEDFITFQRILQNSTTIKQEDKELINRILRDVKDADQREQKIKELGHVFNELEKEVFPGIRRAVISIDYTLTGYTKEGLNKEALLTKAHNNPSGLSAEELLWVSNNLASDNNAKLQLLNASLNVYPDDFALLNNVGAMALVQGDLTKAKTMLDKALNKKDDSKTKNNLAGVSMANGDRATAKKMLSQIKDKTPEVSYNNAIIMILEGKYASAISSCGSEGSFNKALAQVLNGNLSEASKTLAGSNDKESADGYYLKAIIAARSNAGVDAVVSNLKSAISKDKKYKEKAGKDREFIKFMNDATFTSAIN